MSPTSYRTAPPRDKNDYTTTGQVSPLLAAPLQVVAPEIDATASIAAYLLLYDNINAMVEPKLFGSATRTRAILAIALLKETYVRQLAGLLGVSSPVIFRITDDLEREGVVISRYVGRTRTISLNPRLYGIRELEAFLMKYAKGSDVEENVGRIRRRPRRRGKQI
jgi:DNA-binding transcriptional ArsR family regulator